MEHLTPQKYILIDLQGCTKTVSAPTEKDLVIKTNSKRDKFTVIENGVEFFMLIHTLVENHGFQLVSHSERSERDQIKWIKTLERACEEKKIKKLPLPKALAARDPTCFSGIKLENPVIMKNKPIWVIGYDNDPDGRYCALDALSRLLEITQFERKQHLLFDIDPTVVSQATLHGWEAHSLNTSSLKAVIEKLEKKEPVLEFEENHMQNNYQKWKAEIRKASSSSEMKAGDRIQLEDFGDVKEIKKIWSPPKSIIRGLVTRDNEEYGSKSKSFHIENKTKITKTDFQTALGISPLHYECQAQFTGKDLRRPILSIQPMTLESMQGQLCARINGQLFVGTGTLMWVHKNEGLCFVLTAAHNFIQRSISGSSYVSVSASYHHGKLNAEKYLWENDVEIIYTHPDFADNSDPFDGCDIAIGLIERKYSFILPPYYRIGWVEKDKPTSGDIVRLIGYPGEKKGWLYEMAGTIRDVIKTGENYVILYDDIITTKGQSGSALYLKRGDVWVLIGIHVAGSVVDKVNIATAITAKIVKWMEGRSEYSRLSFYFNNVVDNFY